MSDDLAQVLDQAIRHLRAGEFETATREFEALAEKMPQSEDVQLNLSSSKHVLGPAGACTRAAHWADPWG